jgi:hypothetical protein
MFALWRRQPKVGADSIESGYLCYNRGKGGNPVKPFWAAAGGNADDERNTVGVPAFVRGVSSQ